MNEYINKFVLQNEKNKHINKVSNSFNFESSQSSANESFGNQEFDVKIR